jgi:hypothetical protein
MKKGNASLRQQSLHEKNRHFMPIGQSKMITNAISHLVNK